MSSRNANVSTDDLAGILRSEGFAHFGFAELKTPVSIALYEAWLAQGRHGEMDYLKRHLPEKREPVRLMKRAHTAIVVTVDYVPHPEPETRMGELKGLKVAAYARGRDYHHFLRARLERVIARLKDLAPDEDFQCFTDSAPVLERDLAARAGLGWIGKNTCLLSRSEGSLFFIAEIYTTLRLPVADLAPHDHCGTCTRCLDACPTGALVAPRELDARLCISYLTIESREVPPVDLRAKIGSWFFGCDICQNVCPWNIKVHGADELAHTDEDRGDLISDLRLILTASNRELERRFAGTPLLRAGGFGLKRNALVIAGNRAAIELKSEIESLKENVKLGELATWALARIEEAQLRP